MKKTTLYIISWIRITYYSRLHWFLQNYLKTTWLSGTSILSAVPQGSTGISASR